MLLKRIRLVLAFAFANLAVVGLAAPVKFEIKAQPGSSALMAFSAQAAVEVVFSAEDLKEVRANEVIGQFEPEDAIARLLRGTGFGARRNSGGKFVVTAVRGAAAPAVSAAGSVRGSLGWGDGRPAAGVTVAVRETGQTVKTDKYGEYYFSALKAGTYLLVATADGYQPLHIANVVVGAGEDLTLTGQTMRKALDVTKLEPYLVRAGAATVLDPYEVASNRVQPFQSANVDLPRTMDDAQPYLIFERRAIEQSGATSVENFLRQRLPMDATEAPSNFSANNGNFSSFNLRGLGADHTLVLIDGRRPADYNLIATGNQADINGVPLAAIDRIEVLPAAASGIYGASAVGGVINVVLRRNYVGVQVSTSFNNTFSSDAPIRSVNFAGGMSLEGGKTQVMVTGSYSDTKALLVQDRSFVQDGLASIRRNSPAFFLPPNSQPLGATPNIRSNTNTPLFGPGTATYTSVPTGFAGGNLAVTLAALQSKAGTYNYDLAPTHQNGAARYMIGSPGTVTAQQVKLSRQFYPWLEAFVEYRRSTNINQNSEQMPFSATANFSVAATAPTNPFGQVVRLSIPSDPADAIGEFELRLVNLRALAGVIVSLPHEWRLHADLTWNRARTTQSQVAINTTPMNNDFNSGVLNPFRDTVAYPLNLTPYLGRLNLSSQNTLEEYALRSAGPLWSLPAGPIKLAATFSYRKEVIPTYRSDTVYNTPPNSFFVIPARSRGTDALYAEVWAPVVSAKKNWPLLRQLDFQVAGRDERFKVTTATALVSSAAANIVRNKTRYNATTPTYGLRYRPFQDLLLRASYSEAFRPPTYNQSVATPNISSTRVNDPKRGNVSTTVNFTSGTNPDIKPEWAEDKSVGLVWEPKKLTGLRVSVGFSQIKKIDNIATLSVQNVVNFEDYLPDRVEREKPATGDPYPVGSITLVDARSLNLNQALTESYDASVNYSRRTARYGMWNFWSTATWWMHYRVQATVNAPLTEFIGTPGYVKFKAGAGLSCDYNQWTFGWSARFVESSLQRLASVAAQGSDRIPSQHYHDVFVARRFPQAAAGDASWVRRALSRTELQIGVQNVLNKTPPFDAFRTPYYISSYGDARLATYTLTVRKNF
jgi:outer membrane receptor protein involved in Fe transport